MCPVTGEVYQELSTIVEVRGRVLTHRIVCAQDCPLALVSAAQTSVSVPS